MTTQEYYCNFCRNIRYLRAKSGLSKEAMAKKLGIGLCSLSLIESGIMPPKLTCEIITRVYVTFGIAPDKIFLPIDESGTP